MLWRNGLFGFGLEFTRSRSSELEPHKAKTVFEAQLAVANEHSESVFNAARPTRSRSGQEKIRAPEGALIFTQRYYMLG